MNRLLASVINKEKIHFKMSSVAAVIGFLRINPCRVE